MFRHVPIIAVCLLTATTSFAHQAAAEPRPLENHAIKATFTGATIRLDTPLGATLPIHYDENGHVSGEAGNLSWIMGSAADKGRWWIENNRLCHKWAKWFDAENQCLRLKQDGQRLFWVRDDGKTGTATLVASAPPPLQQNQAYASMLPLAAPSKPSQITGPADLVQSAASPSKPENGITPRAPAKLAAASPAAVKAPDPQVMPSKQKATVATKLQLAAAQSTVPARPPMAASSVVMIPTFMVAGVDEDDVLNVRNGPSAGHAPVGALSPQAQGVKILGVCQQEWCPVAHRGITGWVNRFYLVAETSRPVPQLAHTSSASRR